MPMDWNQDPHLQRLEEKLNQVLERLDLIEERMGATQKVLHNPGSCRGSWSQATNS